MNLLHVDSSILGANSVSRQLTAAIAAHVKATLPGISITYEDLAAAPLAHLSPEHLAAAQGATPENATLEADVIHGQKVLEDFLAADIVVLGVPLYNFSIPSQLKAWIDRIAVAGKTFRYSEKGAEGLAGGKKLILVSARGGFYEGVPASIMEHQESYLRGLFRFLGITDLTIVRAEGVNVGPEQRRQAIEAALGDVGRLSLPGAAAVLQTA